MHCLVLESGTGFIQIRKFMPCYNKIYLIFSVLNYELQPPKKKKQKTIIVINLIRTKKNVRSVSLIG